MNIPDSNDRMAGKVAVVTGAGTRGGEGVGNGAAAAILYANEGAQVALLDQEPSWARNTQEKIDDIGGESIVIETDVTDSAESKAAVDRTADEFGTVDVLHNNVGYGKWIGDVTEVDGESWEKAIAVNLESAVNMSRSSIPYMEASGGGSIVNVSSVAAWRPRHGDPRAPDDGGSLATYTTTKSAIHGLTRSMALDHAKDGITVNCIMPGLIWVPKFSVESKRATRQNSTPVPKEGKPWDVGWASVFLASDESNFITGVILPVDGGFLLSGPPKG